MRVAQFVTADLPFPYPVGQVFASLDTTALLTDGLVRHGVEVDWFAAEGTKSLAKVKTLDIEPLRFIKDWETFPQSKKNYISVLYGAAFLSEIASKYEQYDVIHIHTFFLALAFAKLMPKRPVLLTLHDPLMSSVVQRNFNLFKDLKNLHYVSISNNQRLGRTDLNYQATIYHGLNVSQLPWSDSPEDRWVFVGRVVQDKGAHIAVRIAQKAKIKLDIIGPNYLDEEVNSKYFNEQIKPHVDGNNIRYLGPKTRQELNDIYPKAKGFLFPLQWEEPFGLTVIEAMSAGTPTVTFKRGSMPEIIENGKTGYVVENEEEMVVAVSNISKISRDYCRQQALERFSAERVVSDYLTVYNKLISSNPFSSPSRSRFNLFGRR